MHLISCRGMYAASTLVRAAGIVEAPQFVLPTGSSLSYLSTLCTLKKTFQHCTPLTIVFCRVLLLASVFQLILCLDGAVLPLW